MPWYGTALIILAAAFAVALVLIALAAVKIAGRKTPKPPERKA